MLLGLAVIALELSNYAFAFAQHLLIQFFHLGLKPLHLREIRAILVESIVVLNGKLSAPYPHARQDVIIPNLRDRIDIPSFGKLVERLLSQTVALGLSHLLVQIGKP